LTRLQEVDADEQRFAAEQAEIKKRQEVQAKIQSDVNKERQKIAEKKVCSPTQAAITVDNILLECAGNKARMGFWKAWNW
jgi:indole-3-glycerol phosphate synthase